MSLILAGLYLALPTRGAPISNLTDLHNTIAPAWVREPLERGTWRLLCSCTFTLVLCIYTAIHLNIPAYSDTHRKAWRRKVKWAAIALFAPEVVVYVASEQWHLARKFLRELRKMTEESTDERFKQWYGSNPKKSPFDEAYAHFVLMGGFAANVEDLHNTYKIATFTTDGILYLARHGYFCRITHAEIEDKSKADYLAKSLVCIQVLWVIGQAIERKVAGYPITLLEVHTMVHVVCAIVTYALWFQKPLNVQQPMILNSNDKSEIIAFGVQLPMHEDESKTAYDQFEICRRLRYGSIFRPLGPADHSEEYELPKQPPDFVCYFDEAPTTDSTEIYDGRTTIAGLANANGIPTFTHISLLSTTGNHKYKFPRSLAVAYTPAADQEVACTLLSGQSLKCGIGPSFIKVHEESEQSKRKLKSDRNCCPVVVSLSRKDVKRLELTSSFIKRINACVPSPSAIPEYGPAIEGCDSCKSTSLRYLDHECPGRILQIRAVTTRFSLLQGVKRDKMYIGVATNSIPAIYGGVHLGALSVMFPSAWEKILWKAACLYLMGVALFYALESAILFADEMLRKYMVAQAMQLDPDCVDGRFPATAAFATSSFQGDPSRIIGYFFLKVWFYITSSETDSINGPIGSLMTSKLFAFFKGPKHSFRRRALSVALFVIRICYLLVFATTRVYLVTESFISLRRVPIGVYKTPRLNFFNNFPHL